MNEADRQAYRALKQEYQTYVQHWFETEQGQVELEKIDIAQQPVQRKIQPLLKLQKTQAAVQEQEIKQLPYHYVETAQGYTVAGWKLPKRWQFNFYDLLDLLCAQQDWVRIKGIFNTDQGWKSFNFNPQQFNYKSAEESIDNRIEIITQVQQDWLAFETQFLACRINRDG